MSLKNFWAFLALMMAVFAFSETAMAQQTPMPTQQEVIDQQAAQNPAPDPAVAGYGKTKADYDSWRQYFQGGTTTCWGCVLFSKTAEVTVKMGQKGEEVFAASATSAIAAFMGLWIIWQLYLMLSISHANSPAQSIDTIFNRIVIMLIIMGIMRIGVFEYIMQPFLSTLGATMSAAQGLLSIDGGTYGSCSGMGGSGAGSYVAEGNALLCSMQKELGGGIALGTWMMASAEFEFMPWSMDIQQWVMGLIIDCVFFFMIIILPFRFFDAMVRIATVAAILPLIVLAYLFKPSRGIVKQGVTSLLTAMLTFVFTSIAMAIAIEVLHAVTADIYTQVDPSNPANAAFGGINGSDFMVLLTATLGMASMLQGAGNLAAEFAGFQGQMGNAGGAAAGAVTGAANMAMKTAGGGAGMMISNNHLTSKMSGAIKAGKAG